MEATSFGEPTKARQFGIALRRYRVIHGISNVHLRDFEDKHGTNGSFKNQESHHRLVVSGELLNKFLDYFDGGESQEADDLLKLYGAAYKEYRESGVIEWPAQINLGPARSPNTGLKLLGEKIQSIRVARGVSSTLAERAMARWAGIETEDLERLESGTTLSLSESKILKLAEYLDVGDNEKEELQSLYRRAEAERNEEIFRRYGLDDESIRQHRAETSLQQPAIPNGSGLFISYRRIDEAGFAGRLYDRLVEEFGEPAVFMDVDSIELGLDFVEVLNASLAKCAVMIVVIGRQWVSAADDTGRRRLDNKADYVRMEVETALQRDIRVIPILVDGASMPRQDDLPYPLQGFARRNGREMTNARFKTDSEALVATLKRILTDK